VDIEEDTTACGVLFLYRAHLELSKKSSKVSCSEIFTSDKKWLPLAS